jgi:hypothetical protein
MISYELQRTSYNLEKEGKREQIDSQMKKEKKGDGHSHLKI